MTCFKEEDFGEWHDGALFVPATPGAYQFKKKDAENSPILFRYWDGYNWFYCGFTPNQSLVYYTRKEYGMVGNINRSMFRGLKVKHD